jgi:hypothetical protein
VAFCLNHWHGPGDRRPPLGRHLVARLAPARRRSHRRALRRHGRLPLARVPAALSGLAGVRRYLGENLPAEENIECWFGEPIASGDRAAIEWWGSWREQGQELTFAGVTVLRFNDHGKVIDHRDYDNHTERREAPYAGC